MWARNSSSWGQLLRDLRTSEVEIWCLSLWPKTFRNPVRNEKCCARDRQWKCLCVSDIPHSLFIGLEMYFLVHQTFNSWKFHPRTLKWEQELGESGINDLTGSGRRRMTPDSPWWDKWGLAPVCGRMRSQDNPGWKGLWEIIEIGISRSAADLLLLERKCV